jgi:hypothetical protein
MGILTDSRLDHPGKDPHSQFDYFVGLFASLAFCDAMTGATDCGRGHVDQDLSEPIFGHLQQLCVHPYPLGRSIPTRGGESRRHITIHYHDNNITVVPAVSQVRSRASQEQCPSVAYASALYQHDRLVRMPPLLSLVIGPDRPKQPFLVAEVIIKQTDTYTRVCGNLGDTCLVESVLDEITTADEHQSQG